METPEQCVNSAKWYCSGVFVVTFEHISYILVFLLVPLNKETMIISFKLTCVKRLVCLSFFILSRLIWRKESRLSQILAKLRGNVWYSEKF